MMHRHRAVGLHCMPGQARTEKTVGSPVSSAPQQQYEQQQQLYEQQQLLQQQQQQQQQLYEQQQQQMGYAAPTAVYAQSNPAHAMTPPPGQVYAVPQQQIAQPTPYYPQQAPSPLQAQHTGGAIYQQHPVQGQQVQYVQQ